MATIKYIKDVPLVTTVNLTDKLAASQGGTDANTISVGQIIDKHKEEVDPHAGKYARPLGVDDNYVTDAEKVKLSNLSGTNTGDQDLSGYSLTTHNHTGTYEPANANIQSHISSTSNPHGVTAAQAGADPLGTAAGLVSTHASSSDHDGRYYTETETNSLLSGKQNTSEKGQALGYCPLDGSVKIAETYLPDSVLGQVDYQGTWNATTNTPAIPTASSANKGWYYIVAVSGTATIDGISEWTVGDWVISNGTAWNKVDNTDSVSSVFGRAGTIVANSGDYTASQVTNVPQGNIAAITVQAAINELDTEKADKSGKLSQFAATTSAELAGVISDETGSGSLVFATSPALVTPNIGVATGTSFNSITGLATASPLVDGTAAVGASTKAAKEDHVHPTDTSRAADTAVVKLAGDQTVAGVKTFASVVATTADINGGTINGTAIGGTTPATGAFTTLSVWGDPTILGPNNRFAVGNASSADGGMYIRNNGAVDLRFSFVAAGKNTRVIAVTTGNLLSIGDPDTNPNQVNITYTGNILVGTTTDDVVNKLQVNGSGYFSGGITIADLGGNGASFYQSGPCTLTLTDSAGNSATMGSANVFRYIRIGKLVTISGTLHWISTSALAGGSRLRISGLPFTTNGTSNYRAPVVYGSTSPGAFLVPRSRVSFGADAFNTFVWGTYMADDYGTDGDLISSHLATGGMIYGWSMTYECV